MTDHVHEWKWTEVEVSSPLGPFTDKYYRCLKCSKKMYAHKAEARLNATERLSAEDVKDILKWRNDVIIQHALPYNPLHSLVLKAYANILEGK